MKFINFHLLYKGGPGISTRNLLVQLTTRVKLKYYIIAEYDTETYPEFEVFFVLEKGIRRDQFDSLNIFCPKQISAAIIPTHKTSTLGYAVVALLKSQRKVVNTFPDMIVQSDFINKIPYFNDFSFYKAVLKRVPRVFELKETQELYTILKDLLKRLELKSRSLIILPPGTEIVQKASPVKQSWFVQILAFFSLR